MTDITTKVRAHFSATNLSSRIKSALAPITPEEHTLTVAPLDQCHTRGILATPNWPPPSGSSRQPGNSFFGSIQTFRAGR